MPLLEFRSQVMLKKKEKHLIYCCTVNQNPHLKQVFLTPEILFEKEHVRALTFSLKRLLI